MEPESKLEIPVELIDWSCNSSEPASLSARLSMSCGDGFPISFHQPLRPHSIFTNYWTVINEEGWANHSKS